MSKKKTGLELLLAVRVTWLDSVMSPGWVNESPLGDNMEHESVGYLVAKTKDRIVLAQSRGAYSIGQHLTIPRCAVKSIKRLK
jgi:hypothetical protein